MNPRHHVGWLVVALIALVAPAAGAATGGGILTQFPVPGGCYAELAASGCQDSNHLVHATGVVVSPDGRTAYVASPDSDSVTGYSLDPATGAITGRIACWSKAVATPTCNQGSGLDGARGLALAPDG
ncbi:MAG: Lactonase, 7-bladed beta-propeller, partial [Solirubrobacteraceae bacterium]|nr:Lactonase, 7-bladed beta-propeller [Solirubrobacteraceae bacterium]